MAEEAPPRAQEPRRQSVQFQCWKSSRVRGFEAGQNAGKPRASPSPFWGLPNRITADSPPPFHLSPRSAGGDNEGRGGSADLAETKTARREVGRSVEQERAGNGLFSARGCPPSIVSAAAFHFRVRDGNGWSHRALITSSREIVARKTVRPAYLPPHIARSRLRIARDPLSTRSACEQSKSETRSVKRRLNR